MFVVDTEQTRIEGTGTFDLNHETFDATIAPKPKHAGILSLRTPVRLNGTFRHPEYQLDKTGLALRAGGALALAAVAPIAAVLPPIETGPGADIDCKHATSIALARQGKSAATAALASSPRGRRCAATGEKRNGGVWPLRQKFDTRKSRVSTTTGKRRPKLPSLGASTAKGDIAKNVDNVARDLRACRSK